MHIDDVMEELKQPHYPKELVWAFHDHREKNFQPLLDALYEAKSALIRRACDAGQDWDTQSDILSLQKAISEAEQVEVPEYEN